MQKNKNQGKFIVFEGLDGSGSSTQSELLAKWFKERGEKVLLTKEPTNNIIGGLIRGQLTHDWKTGPECLQLLFAADRAHHLEREIIPALDRGYNVISDRYFFSSIAFGSLEIDKEWLLKLNEKFLEPDLTIFLKVSPQECVKRMEKSRFQLELFEEEQRLERVWKTYQWLANRFESAMIVNGEETPEKISQNIIEIVSRRFKV